jgi:hypothetical protein
MTSTLRPCRLVMPTKVGIHVFFADVNDDVDGVPAPAMTLKGPRRRVSLSADWYDR